MSIFAGNLASKISLSLQFRAFSFPWVKWNSAILCLKEREYSSHSSVPLRYIPKRSSKSGTMENSLPTKESEKKVFDKSLDGVRRNFGLNEKLKNQKQMCKVTRNFGLNEKLKNQNQMCQESLLSDKLTFDDAQLGKQDVQKVTAVPQVEEEINHELGSISHEPMGEPEEATEEIGMQHGNNSSKQSLQLSNAMQDAEKLAIGLLAKRAFTAVELRKKLQGKRLPHDIVEELITDFQRRGLINDGLYAETYSRSRWSSSTWGPRRIKQALTKKGVSETDTQKALKLVFEDGESRDQESNAGLSKLSMDQLLAQATKQWLRGKDVAKDTRKARIIRWLQYRGFNWDVISFVLKRLESQHTT